MLITMTVTLAQRGSEKKGRLLFSAIHPMFLSKTLTAPLGCSMVRMIRSDTNMGTAQGRIKQKRQKPLAFVFFRLMIRARIMPEK